MELNEWNKVSSPYIYRSDLKYYEINKEVQRRLRKKQSDELFGEGRRFLRGKRKGRVVTYDKLKFPLRPFIQLKTKEMENFFGIPYNYLIEGEIFSAGTDSSNQGAKFVIRDPDFGEVTNTLSKMAHETLTQSEPAQIELKWGWCDADGKSYIIDRAWTLGLKNIDATIDTFGATFNLELFWVGLKTLYSSVGNHINNGIKTDMNAAKVLYKIIDNYNKHVGWKEVILVPSFEILPDKIRKAPSLNGYDPGNKTLIEIIKELTGFMSLNRSPVDPGEKYRIVPEILVSDVAVDPKNKNKKIGSEIHLLYRKDSTLLETMYVGSTYYYLHSEKSNILEFNLKYNSWMTLLGNIESSITNKQRGIWESEHTEHDKDIHTYRGVYTTKYRRDLINSPINNAYDDYAKKKEYNPKVEKTKGTIIDGPIDVDVVNNRTSKDVISVYTKAVLERVSENLVTGSITILGDPNIYDPVESISGKHIYIEGGINNKGSNIEKKHSEGNIGKQHFFDGKYLIKGFSHSFSGQKWTTKLELVKVYSEDGK